MISQRDFPVLVFSLALLVSGCDKSQRTDSTPTPTPTPVPVAVVLQRGTYTSPGDGTTWPYELLRLPNADGGSAYAQWFPPRTSSAKPVVVAVEPYAGIDWTGEAVDTRWASKDIGAYPDVDGPNYPTPNITSVIGYEKYTPEKVGNNSEIYLRNDFGVLTVFGRFYAGGSVWNDVQDSVAGLQFLSTQSNVDTAHIGMIGTSWGGFETVYGAAYAPASVTPLVAAAVAPVLDFEAWVNFVTNELPFVTNPAIQPQYANFFDAYLRRLFVTAGGVPGATSADYSRVNAAALALRLRTRLLIAHDDGDTILPVGISRSFVAANSALTQGFWHEQSDPPPAYNTNILTHGPMGKATVYAPVYSFSLAFMFAAIAKSEQLYFVPFGNVDFDVFFDKIHSYQGVRDVAWVAPRLLELCDARVLMYDLTLGSTLPIQSGAQLLATKINDEWGTVVDAGTVCTQLADKGLPPW